MQIRPIDGSGRIRVAESSPIIPIFEIPEYEILKSSPEVGSTGEEVLPHGPPGRQDWERRSLVRATKESTAWPLRQTSSLVSHAERNQISNYPSAPAGF